MAISLPPQPETFAMRTLNFSLLFVFCLAFVFFGVQNTQPATVQIYENIEFQAPLAVELIIAMGLGAGLAWLYGMWSQLERLLTLGPKNLRIRKQQNRIEALEEDIERYKAELQTQQLRLPVAPEPLAEQTAVLVDQEEAAVENRVVKFKHFFTRNQ
ncbi:LapA family protein [Ancylothrix sp. C2]|uniref:LapA family protein n=1 Tax=Ancylothrix sp. D3o TaxID=2953691 RepID=UPI0021BA4605|nr:LapA family protein [Ancylothrix sp. D3o]MCT7949310.1 LapA family protein [Ancylothrix sp. D3o]